MRWIRTLFRSHPSQLLDNFSGGFGDVFRTIFSKFSAKNRLLFASFLRYLVTVLGAFLAQWGPLGTSGVPKSLQKHTKHTFKTTMSVLLGAVGMAGEIILAHLEPFWTPKWTPQFAKVRTEKGVNFGVRFSPHLRVGI